eukprot:5316472-Pyramimonas_sp.AAC.2
MTFVWYAAVGSPVARPTVRVRAPVALALAAFGALILLARGVRRPLHGGPIDPAPPRGGSVCGGARVEEINLENNAQKTERSALLATRMLD